MNLASYWMLRIKSICFYRFAFEPASGKGQASLDGHAMTYSIRRVLPESESEIALIASRMRETLMEVLGEAEGGSMYTSEWLEARVRFHLEPDRVSEVFVAEVDAKLVGHTIVRLETDDDGDYGLFSTTYVVEEYRRQKIANALLLRGEQWMMDCGLYRAGTNTSDTNEKLINLYERHGYKVVLNSQNMVHLSKVLTAD